jgi:hypothetical protein
LKRRLISLLHSIAQRSLLTPEEKRVLCFVLVAFLLGMAVKYYRDTHRESLPRANGNFRSSPHSDPATISPPPKKKQPGKKPPNAIAPSRN